MTESIAYMTLNGHEPVTVLAKLIGKLMLLTDAVTDKWVTAEYVDLTHNLTDGAIYCGPPYQIVCTTTESGHTFAASLADAIEALIGAVPYLLHSLGATSG